MAAATSSSEQELQQRSRNDLISLVQRLEGDKLTLMSEHSSMMREVNRRLQMHLVEIRGLREANERADADARGLREAADRAAAEGIELRELCCFLDDERQRLRRLAREWQRYGRRTSAAVSDDLVTLAARLADLECRQAAVVGDNVQLQELCIYLDHKRLAAASPSLCSADNSSRSEQRDPGDGVSYPATERSKDGPNVSTNGTALNYIKVLEDKVRRLEQERDHYQTVHGTVQSIVHPRDSDAMLYAMKVLEVHERLERPCVDASNAPMSKNHSVDEGKMRRQVEGRGSGHGDDEELGDTEKAIVRELCNVIWRKLEDRRTQVPSQSVAGSADDDIHRGRTAALGASLGTSSQQATSGTHARPVAASNSAHCTSSGGGASYGRVSGRDNAPTYSGSATHASNASFSGDASAHSSASLTGGPVICGNSAATYVYPSTTSSGGPDGGGTVTYSGGSTVHSNVAPFVSPGSQSSAVSNGSSASYRALPNWEDNVGGAPQSVVASSYNSLAAMHGNAVGQVNVLTNRNDVSSRSSSTSSTGSWVAYSGYGNRAASLNSSGPNSQPTMTAGMDPALASNGRLSDVNRLPAYYQQPQLRPSVAPPRQPVPPSAAPWGGPPAPPDGSRGVPVWISGSGRDPGAGLGR